ncbi:MAG TPA: glycine betaine ABC transporter substrate-binding protein [Acidimicrobiia bacterium]|nr:glycine betaine ABC transporter substrate-binding protein [Acidimicrobiia bacterium]
MKRILLVFVVLALIVAACGGDGEGSGDGDGGGTETITLIVNPWTASRLNAEVAKNIIESQLGNPVEITEVNENDAMFTGMADGTLDAVLEIWPSGVTDAENAYFEDGSVVELGELGAVGKIGWFVPQYVIDENPELATWEGFQDPELAGLFATAETGDNGRFLGTDPSYSQYDEQIIENLGLPLEVVFSGSEPATVAEVDARVAAEEPVLLYWWTPTAAVSAYDLVNVTLPEYNEECGASAAAGDGGVDCDYPEDVLFKAASGMLEEKDANVFAFLEAFTITTEDQLEMLPAVEIDGEDPADVAAEWVSANEDVWSAWLP